MHSPNWSITINKAHTLSADFELADLIKHVQYRVSANYHDILVLLEPILSELVCEYILYTFIVSGFSVQKE